MESAEEPTIDASVQGVVKSEPLSECLLDPLVFFGLFCGALAVV